MLLVRTGSDVGVSTGGCNPLGERQPGPLAGRPELEVVPALVGGCPAGD
jgi:hypothetical protein